MPPPICVSVGVDLYCTDDDGAAKLLSLDTTNIYAEVDLAMKAKALGECSIPDDSRRHWRKEPGLMAFLRSL